MNSTLKTALALSLVAVLTACGGGDVTSGSDTGGAGGNGGTGGANTPPTTANKYEGTHSYCDDDHTRYRVTLTSTGNNNYRAKFSDITYQNSNCTGSVLATYSEPLESTLTFIETATANVSAQGLASSLSIDKYKFNVPQQIATLTGPNVVGDCVNYPGPDGKFCYEQLNIAAEQVDWGLYKTSAGFYLLNLVNGTYDNEERSVYVKE